MVRKISVLFFCILCFGSSKLKAQRYLNKIFNDVSITADISYGSAYDWKDTIQTLLLDIYEPSGDTVSNRPVIIFAHGGTFITGNRKSADIVKFCNLFAQRGYVCVSIEYRLGVNAFNPKGLPYEFSYAAMRAIHDGRAAVRFFRKDISENNTYRIDESKIFFGGISSGAITALQLAICDNDSELSQISDIDTSLVGGVEGKSGNPGYSWKVRGVINLSGALIDNNSWLNNNSDINICSVHGTNDQTVPYKSDYFYYFGKELVKLQGSFIVDSIAKELGMNSELLSFNGAGHIPFSTDSAYMDSTEDFVASFLYKIVRYPTGIASKEINLNNLLYIYPLPAMEQITILFNSSEPFNISVSDFWGRQLFSQKNVRDRFLINRERFESGIYFIEIDGDFGKLTRKIILD